LAFDLAPSVIGLLRETHEWAFEMARSVGGDKR